MSERPEPVWSEEEVDQMKAEIDQFAARNETQARIILEKDEEIARLKGEIDTLKKCTRTRS
jgi:hypothetical protein